MAFPCISWVLVIHAPEPQEHAQADVVANRSDASRIAPTVKVFIAA
jgi:hypothetical protein